MSPQAALETGKEFMARHRFAHITARKARYVADLIRGRSVNEALELLQFTPNRGATFYGKVLRSAVANASQDEDVNINRLVVSFCVADDGPLLQGRMRYRPGPQGRAMPFAKRLSHLTVKVREVVLEGAPEKRSIETAGAEAAPAKRAKRAKPAEHAKAESKKPAKKKPEGAKAKKKGEKKA
jgi:large subunit ribosomal protein L22